MKKILPLIFLLIGIHIQAQENNEEMPVQELVATVVNAQTDFPLESVHVINLNRVVGTITNQKKNEG